MTSHTSRSRIAELLQRSRRALRLYSSIGKSAVHANTYSEKQAIEWRDVNSELTQSLSRSLEKPSTKSLLDEVALLRDRFHDEWKRSESKMQVSKKELVEALDRGDFVKCSLLSENLVILKSRSEATYAAYSELTSVIGDRVTSELSSANLATEIEERHIKLMSHQVISLPQDSNDRRLAKIIPIRRLG